MVYHDNRDSVLIQILYNIENLFTSQRIQLCRTFVQYEDLGLHDKVMVLDAGEVVAIDEPKKIFGNPDIVAHHIGVPDYVKICNALKEKGYTDREIEITEEPTIELVKEALKG